MLVGDGRQQRLNIGSEVGFGRDDHLRRGTACDDRIDRKAILAHHRRIALAQKGLSEQVEEIVGAGAADDACRVNAVDLAERLAQQPRRALGIDLQLAGKLLIGRNRLGTGAEW